MFVSYLVVIPAYAAFVAHLEVKFFRNYRLFYNSILEHGTLAQIRANGRRLRDETIASLSGITVPQLLICGLVALSAPAVIELLDMQYRQVGTLRFGLIGAVFQFLFVTCSSLTLYFDRRIVFLILQACFMILNATLTWALIPFGANYLGLGFLAAVGDLGADRLPGARPHALPARLPDLHRQQPGGAHATADADGLT